MIDSDDDIYIYLCKEQKKMYLVNGWASVYLNSIYRCGCFVCVHVVLCNSCNTNVFVSINAP